ncbi:MAG TPA: hypothetical protein VGI71_16740, partial [Scandinavium sp.]
ILLARARGEGGGGDWPPPSCARCRDVKGKREPEGAQRFTGLKKGLTDKHYLFAAVFLHR